VSGNALTNTITIIGLIINGAGLVFIAAQVILARRQLKENLSQAAREADRIKRQATVEFYMSTAQKVSEWRSIIPDDWDKVRIGAFTRNVYRRNDKAKMLVLASYLGFFEALAVAIRADVYDLTTFDAIAGSRILNICQNYQQFFALRRKEVGSSFAYRNLEWLGNALSELRASAAYENAPRQGKLT
jgi:hypothetical protein